MGVSTTPIEAARRQQLGKQTLRWNRFGELIPALFGIAWLVIAFYPILFMLMTSLRPLTDFFTDVPWLPPTHPTVANYQNVLASNFGIYFVNSIFVTVISVLLILVVSLLAAYAISRIRNRFTLGIFSLFLFGLAIPLQATIIPIYAMITALHLYDTLFALILPYVSFGIPLSVLVLVTYIRDIPKALHEAMYLDGAGHLRILGSLVLPLSRRGGITVI